MRPVSTPSPQPHCSKDEEPKRQIDKKESREKPKESSQPSTSFAHSSLYAQHERDYPYRHTETHPSSSGYYHPYPHSSYSESARYRHRSKHSFRRTDRSSDRHESSARHSSVIETRKRRHEGSSQYEPYKKHQSSTSYPPPSSYRRVEIDKSHRGSASTSKLDVAIESVITNAIKHDNDTKLRELLAVHSVNFKTLIGINNLLTLSAKYGANKCATLLLSRGFDINAKDPNGNTALITACQFGHSKLLRLLITKGANLEILNDFGENALNTAVKRDYIACVKILCPNIKFPLHGRYHKTGLMHAVNENRPHILSELLKFDKSVDCCDDRGQTAIHLAANMGNKLMLSMLLEHSHNLDIEDFKNNTPLLRAVLNRHLVCAKLLLEKGANCELQNKFGNNALILASRNHDRVMMELLLRYGATPATTDIHGKTALHHILDPFHQIKHKKIDLSMSEMEKMVRLLLTADPNIVNGKEDGKTGLMLAASQGWLSITKVLLKFNADKFLCDNHGKTAFMNAIKHQNIECAELVFDQRLIDTPDGWGKTALMFAVINRDAKAVKFLIENKANLDLAEANHGLTALMYAVINSSYECAKILLKSGCNHGIRNKQKSTALEIAYEYGDPQMIQLLKRYQERYL